MRDQFFAFCLTPDLCLGRTVLMMLAAFDVDNDMNEILLPFSEFENPRFGRFSSVRIEIRFHMPLDIH
jgi:hypothetical protein